MSAIEIVGLDSTPMLYPHAWTIEAETADLAPIQTQCGHRFTLSTCNYGPSGKRLLERNAMTVLAQCSPREGKWLQIGEVSLSNNLRSDMERYIRLIGQRIDQFEQHHARVERGQSHPGWETSMEDMDAALTDEMDIWMGHSYRALRTKDHIIHTDPRITRDWVMALAKEQLAIHYTKPPRLSSAAIDMIEVSRSPQVAIMEAVNHHLSLQEVPFITEKTYRVSGEKERVAGANIDDRYQIRFDFQPPEHLNYRTREFLEMMEQAYWQMHLGFSQAA